jgi:hypothetical protein
LTDETGEQLSGKSRHIAIRVVRELYRARQWVRAFGGIPNLYSDYHGTDPTENNGRLWGAGEYHPQRIKRIALPLIFGGTGWRDYDFRLCHPTIMVALAAAYHTPMPLLADYVDNRDAWVERLSDHLDIRRASIKELMNSALYGAPLSLNPRSSVYGLVGHRGVALLKSYQPYLDLRAEIRGASKVIVRNHVVGDHVQNAVGKRRSLQRATRRRGKSSYKQPRAEFTRKLLSHVLTGYEAWALNVVCRNRDDVLVLMHDGFICASERDENRLQALIVQESNRQFGFVISLKLSLKTDFGS